MAQNIPLNLFQFLTRTEISKIPLGNTVDGPNTRSSAYDLNAITVTRWTDFSYTTIMQSSYAAILTATMVPNPPQTTPPRAVYGEESVKARLTELVLKRLRRALLVTQYPDGHTPMTVDMFESSRFPYIESDARPDIAGFTDQRKQSLRLPADIKCSWKWRSNWITRAATNYSRTEFFAVAAQLNFYMNTVGSRYGYVITDDEVAFFRKKDGEYANCLEMAPGIPLNFHDSTNSFTLQHGRVTALLGLWYIHMLASDDAQWEVDAYSEDSDDVVDRSSDSTYQN